MESTTDSSSCAQVNNNKKKDENFLNRQFSGVKVQFILRCCLGMEKFVRRNSLLLIKQLL